MGEVAKVYRYSNGSVIVSTVMVVFLQVVHWGKFSVITSCYEIKCLLLLQEQTSSLI